MWQIFKLTWMRWREAPSRWVLGVSTATVLFLGIDVEDLAILNPELLVERGITAMLLFITLETLFIYTLEIPKEINTGNLIVFLSRPISRGRYLFGKFCGLMALTITHLVILMTLFVTCLTVKNDYLPLEFYWRMVQIGELALVVGSIGFMFSTCFSEILATICTVAILAVGYTNFILPLLFKAMAGAGVSVLMLVFYYMTPNFQHFLHDVFPEPGIAMLALLGYSLGYSAIFLTLGLVAFRRREF